MATNGLLAEDDAPIDVDIKDTASRRDKRHFLHLLRRSDRALQGFDEFDRQTGGPGQVVSLSAERDPNLHRVSLALLRSLPLAF